ncbi:MAG: glycine--tRNA ligase [Puniceicoccales bacterium]|jgi:glycyl-tRNA synthetase|nr:glycine--tRNA ligase [Puniceicoccales bacterium]
MDYSADDANGSGNVADGANLMDRIISLAKRRGFIFKSSDIYGGMNGFFDYGPLGTELKRNIKDAWWNDVVRGRDDVVGIDCAVISHQKIWEASGHVAGFSDPMVDCRESKKRFRADQLFFAEVTAGEESIGYVCLQECDDLNGEITRAAELLAKKLKKSGPLEISEVRAVADASADEMRLIPSPETGTVGALTPPRAFNLMFQTHVGAVSDDASAAYLRPETAQGTFVNFQNVLASARVKIPFGIAQIGKSFRNEITPRNFIFRSREFEQMELEFFIDDSDEAWKKWHTYWIAERMKWYESVGIGGDWLSLDVHSGEKLAHYSKACTDITFRYPFGVQELEGIAARGCFDLTQHQKCSGKSMEYFDEISRKKYIPHVIEPAAGVDRILLAVLCSAYHEEQVDGELRVVLRFAPRVAPVKAAVFPLLKNNPEIVAKSREIYDSLRRRWNVYYDAGGAIGRRYRRMDEIGTPFCVTVDFDTLSDGSVTLRDRDSMQQERIRAEEVVHFIGERCF